MLEIAAIICGIFAMTKKNKNYSIAGIICSAIGLIICIAILISNMYGQYTWFVSLDIIVYIVCIILSIIGISHSEES